MPKLSRAKGLAALQGGGNGGGGGRGVASFTPTFFINKKKGETEKFILILTDINDVEKVWLHKFVRVPDDRPGKTEKFEVFASRWRNPEWDDEDYAFIERELRHQPENKVAAIAVELEPVYKDGAKETLANIDHFEVAVGESTNDEGETTLWPRWTLIHEAQQGFWAEAMFLYEDNGTINTPVRVKKGDQGSWNFKEVNADVYLDGKQVSLEDLRENDRIPSLEDEIKRLGSKERWNHYFGEGVERLTQNQRFQSEWWKTELGFDDDEEDKDEAPNSKSKQRTPISKKRKVSISDLDNLTGIDDYDDDSEEDETY